MKGKISANSAKMTDNKYKMVGNVPSDISVVRFATVRAQEIVALTKMIGELVSHFCL